MKSFKNRIRRWLKLYRRGSIKVTNLDYIHMCMHGFGKSKVQPYVHFRIGRFFFWYDESNRHFYLDPTLGDIVPDDIKDMTTRKETTDEN